MTLDINMINGTFGQLSTDKKIALLIPVYNESLSIESSIKKILNELMFNNIASVVIVDDGSTDDTLITIKKIQSNKIKILSYKKNMGYGFALKYGYTKMRSFYDYFIVMDSDLTNPPSEIKNFVNKINQGFDYIKASRFEKGGKMVNVPAFRKLHSVLGSLVAKFLLKTNISDPTNGFRAFKSSTVDISNLKKNDFSIIIEELVSVLNDKNLKITNVPSVLYSRSNDQKNSTFTYDIDTYLNYLKPCLRFFFKG